MNKIAQLLLIRVKNGEMELSQVPTPYREKIRVALEELNNNG